MSIFNASNNTVTITGNGAPGFTVVVKGPGGTQIGTTTVASEGNFTFTTSTTGILPGGTSTITVAQTNPQGATSAPTTAGTVTIPAPPVVSQTTISGNKATIGGTGQPGATVQVILQNGTAIGSSTVLPNGTFTVTTSNLTIGIYIANVTQTDSKGMTGIRVSSLSIGIAAPSPPVVQGFSGFIDEISVWGTGEPGNTVDVKANGTSIAWGYIDDGGFFNITATGLSVGAYNITASQTNAAGASTEAGWSLGPPSAVVSAPPVAFGIWLDDGGMLSVNGTAEPGNTVNLYANETLVGTTITSGTGLYKVTTGWSLGTGYYDISLTQSNGVFTSGFLQKGGFNLPPRKTTSATPTASTTQTTWTTGTTSVTTSTVSNRVIMLLFILISRLTNDPALVF